MTDLPFPSVTICSPGLNMEAVKKELLDDFSSWLNETGKTERNYKAQMDEFLKEKYATTGSIFDMIKAMNLPPPSDSKESTGSSAVLHNQALCRAKSEQDDTASRMKRSSEGQSKIFH